MGVNGLWKLIEPFSRTVQLESLSSKKLAIDASIWLHQFIKAMRDSQGNQVKGAHIIGFFRRICKLLFYGIKPVFVYDGQPPVLKQHTLTKRRKRKADVDTSLKRTAQKLLETTLKIHAIDISINTKIPSASNTRKTDDEYAIHANLNEIIFPEDDSRLVTEAELRDFITQHLPSTTSHTDILDTNLFHKLPIEIQHDIILDKKLESRKTSWSRLSEMIRSTPTSLEFSKLQINNLVHRNTMTSKLSDFTRNANIVNNPSKKNSGRVVVNRIASERNRAYVLVKNDGEENTGGWTMKLQQVRDHAVRNSNSNEFEKDPSESGQDLHELYEDESIQIAIQKSLQQNRMIIPKNYESSNDEDDEEFEEVKPSTTNKSLFSKNRVNDDEAPLFEDMTDMNHLFNEDDNARNKIKLSANDYKTESLCEISSDKEFMLSKDFLSSHEIKSINKESLLTGASKSETDFHDELFSFTKIEDTILDASPSFDESPNFESYAITKTSSLSEASNSIINQTASLIETSTKLSNDQSLLFEIPNLNSSIAVKSSLLSELTDNIPITSKSTSPLICSSNDKPKSFNKKSEFEDASNINADPVRLLSPCKTSLYSDYFEENSTFTFEESKPLLQSTQTTSDLIQTETPITTHDLPSLGTISQILNKTPLEDLETTLFQMIEKNNDLEYVESILKLGQEVIAQMSGNTVLNDLNSDAIEVTSTINDANAIFNDTKEMETNQPNTFEEVSDEDALDNLDQDDRQIPNISIQVEENDYTSFLESIKADSALTREALTNQVNVLQEQSRKETRTSSTMTTEMIKETQQLLQFFGIPYIVAPSEAESQCAFLESSNIVDGIITDDSDVFLFGGSLVYRNMFNASKHVQVYNANDLKAKAMNRDLFIQLAFLLGSDYTSGVNGIGVVNAMEILQEWSDEKLQGLSTFRKWCQDQQELFPPSTEMSKFQKKFIKTAKKCEFESGFPDERVYDAYASPDVDETLTNFQWGGIDLDAIRDFMFEKVGWEAQKVDDVLIPVMKEMRKRSTGGGQQTLDKYFSEIGSVHGNKRIQNVLERMGSQKGKGKRKGDTVKSKKAKIQS